MSVKVLITARSFSRVEGAHQALLTERGYDLVLAELDAPHDAERLAELIPGVDGAIVGLDHFERSVFERSKRLRVVSRFGVGVDRVDLQAAADHGVAVTITSGANAVAVAELALGLMFTLARNLVQHAAATRNGDWSRTLGWELTGRTLGVVGFGAIGREVARRARGLGLRVVACDPLLKRAAKGVELMPLEALLPQADIVTIHAPLTRATRHLIGARELALMKPGAVLVNTARGGLVDEAALAGALRDGRLAGAASDVFEHEPPIDSPLPTMANLIATPHIGSSTREAIVRMGIMAAENLIAVLEGRPCAHLVIPADGTTSA